jgi:hypothetical protein
MVLALVSLLFFAVSGFCKAAMDARVFQSREVAFRKYPAWFREWMQKRGEIPIIKIDDGWHSMQMLMFLSIALGYLCYAPLFQQFGCWILLSIPIRTVIHGLVFEAAYKSMK